MPERQQPPFSTPLDSIPTKVEIEVFSTLPFETDGLPDFEPDVQTDVPANHKGDPRDIIDK